MFLDKVDDLHFKILQNDFQDVAYSSTGAFVSTDPWDEFEYAVDLDVAGKYWMFWTPDDETQTITFEVGTFSNLIVIFQIIDQYNIKSTFRSFYRYM